MLSKIRNLSVLVAFVLLGIMIYEAGFKDRSHAWMNYIEPQMASYTSLEEEEKILKELGRERYSIHKTRDPTFIVRPSIFNTIQSR